MALTDQATVELLLSQEGAADYLEDLDPTDQAAFWTDTLEETDATIYMYLSKLYDPTTIQNNKWVSSKARWLAACLFTKRRGNAYYFSDTCEEIINTLEQMMMGLIHLPDDDGSLAPRGVASMPATANLIVDDRSFNVPIRVDLVTYAGVEAKDLFPFSGWWHWY